MLIHQFFKVVGSKLYSQLLGRPLANRYKGGAIQRQLLLSVGKSLTLMSFRAKQLYITVRPRTNDCYVSKNIKGRKGLFMRQTNKKPYAGYKRAHLYSAIGTIVLGLCLIIAVIIMAVNFKVEIKVNQQPITTTPVQQQPVVEDTKGSTEDPQIEEIPTEEISAVEEITPTEEPTAKEIIPAEETPVEETTTPVEEVAEPVTEEPTIEEPVITEPTTEETPTEEAEIEIVTVLVTVNFYNNGCTTKTVEIRTEANTILTKADIKNLVAELYPVWGRVSSTGLPNEFTATDGAKVPGTVKLYLV